MKIKKKYMKKAIVWLLLILTVVSPVLGQLARGYYVHAYQICEGAEKELPIYCVNTNGEKKVALTFDAAWGAEDTDEILEILKRYDVKATFFVVGDWVRKYPDVVKKIADAGHDIANHSNKHPHMNSMGMEEIKKDILAAGEEIEKVTGKPCNLFRAPYGEYNNTVIKAAKACNYYAVQWDVDSLDWKEYGLAPLIDKVVNHKNLRPGSIILMHNGTKYTAKALESIIKGVKDKGYTFVPISKLIITDKPYVLDHEGRQQLKQ